MMQEALNKKRVRSESCEMVGNVAKKLLLSRLVL